ncbi:MAG: hypothetical protein CM1200mP24_09480 [Gammaproteobacteria bacterium]|nr:MAG: hypothetical protein CM1200mP24_09480 [Gammaproteobacteria bacterium]
MFLLIDQSGGVYRKTPTNRRMAISLGTARKKHQHKSIRICPPLGLTARNIENQESGPHIAYLQSFPVANRARIYLFEEENTDTSGSDTISLA